MPSHKPNTKANRVKKLTSKEMNSLIFQRSANATPSQVHQENKDRRRGILAPAGRMVVSPEGKDTQLIPQTSNTAKLMREGESVRNIEKRNEAVELRGDVRRRRAAPKAGSISTQGVAHSKRKTGPRDQK